MDDHEHFQRLNRYFDHSRLLYNGLLWGARHFGFYPPGQALSEREAQVCMQDFVGTALQLSSGMRVLDAGCGRGIVAVYLARKFACQLQGIDIRPGDIARAQRLAEDAAVAHRVEFAVMDYADLTFADASFDAIYTLESLSHATHLHTTLNEFWRVLKHGGKLALCEYTIAPDDQFAASEKALLETVIHASAMDGLPEFRHDRVHQLLQRAGFHTVQVRNISAQVRPSLGRLRRLFYAPYLLVKLLGQQHRYPNLTAAVEFYPMTHEDLIRYNIITAEK